MAKARRRGRTVEAGDGPTDARLRRGELVMVEERDPELHPVRHYRTRDTVAILAGNGSLSRREVAAAKLLRDLGDQAALHGVRAAGTEAGGGNPSDRLPMTEVQERARRLLRRFAGLFGGHDTPGGSILIRVLCQGISLAEWTAEQPAKARQPLNTRHAAGIVVVVLGVVAADLDRTGRWRGRTPAPGAGPASEADTR